MRKTIIDWAGTKSGRLTIISVFSVALLVAIVAAVAAAGQSEPSEEASRTAIRDAVTAHREVLATKAANRPTQRPTLTPTRRPRPTSTPTHVDMIQRWEAERDEWYYSLHPLQKEIADGWCMTAQREHEAMMFVFVPANGYSQEKQNEVQSAMAEVDAKIVGYLRESLSSAPAWLHDQDVQSADFCPWASR